MRTPRHLLILTCAVLALSGPYVLGATTAPNSSQYVTRKDYNKLAKRLDEVNRKLNRLEKKSANKQETQQNLQYINQELKSIKKIAFMNKPGTTHFTIVGEAEATWQNVKGSPNTFDYGFGPLFLWQINKRLLMEAALEVGSDGVSPDLANLTYTVNDHLAIGAGMFPPRFGKYHNHLDPSWIDKLPDDPLVMNVDANGFSPDTMVGAYATGAFSVGQNSQFTYNAFVTNGPTLNTSGDTAGSLSWDPDNTPDMNNNKTVGGRIAFLPIPAIEIGYSIEAGQATPSGSAISNAHVMLNDVDFSFKKDIHPLDGTVDFRAEWIWEHVGRVSYPAQYDSNGNLVFPGATFANNSNGGYAQLAYRPTDVSNKILKNCEVAFRYDRLRNMQYAAVREERYTVGMDYWLNPSTVIKGAYEWYTNTHGAPKQDGVLLQYAVGF